MANELDSGHAPVEVRRSLGEGGRKRANWAYRERLQLVSRSPQVLGGGQTIPETKTCSRRGGAFVSAGLVVDAVRQS